MSNHHMSANYIKNQAKNIIRGKSTASSSSNNDPDIEIIEHFTEFSPATIHNKTKERIKHIGTVKYGEPTSYVTSKLSLSEIKERAKAKLRKNGENKREASTVSAVHEPPSKKAKPASPNSSSFSKNAGAAALFTPRMPEVLQREPSPEVEILEVKESETPPSVKTTSSELQEIARLLFKDNKPNLASDSNSVEPGVASSSRSVIVPNPVIEGPRTVLQTPRRLTEESYESGTVPKPVSEEPRKVSNAQSLRTPARLMEDSSGSATVPNPITDESRKVPISQPRRKTILIEELPGSATVPPAVPPQPKTVFNTQSPWTPRRLVEETPPKPSTSKEPSSTSPKRGVRRLMQDGENDGEAAGPSTETQHTISKFSYLEAFKLMLTSVWQCPQNAPLFDFDDLEKFNLFMSLSEAAKALYVQLLKMKLQWRQVSTLKYPEIGLDLVPVIKELVLQQFLDSDENLDDLPVLLGMLKMPELKSLMQEFQLPVKGRKVAMMTALIDHARSQRSIANGFLQANQTNINSRIVERLKAILGPCVKLSQDMADTMHRCFLLGILPSCHSEETLGQFVLRIHKVRTKQLLYPEVHLKRFRQIFPNKAGFIKFQVAHRLFQEGQQFVADKNWDGVITVTNRAKEIFSEVLQDEMIRKHDEELPLFLRSFTAGSTLASVISFGLDAFGRRKDYATVVNLLELLLSQKLYRKRKRGFWYERLALTLHVHLKNNNQAADVVLKAMEDPDVHLINRVGIVYRASQLLNRGRAWKPPTYLHTALSDLLTTPLIEEVGTTTIQAKSRQSKGQGLRLDYVHESSDGEQVVVSSVEEFAISYYKTKEEFTEGLHAEGSTIVSLFGIIFWDIIYEKYVPDAFLSPHQEKPLDLYSKEFYEHRQEDIEARLEEIQNWGDDEAITFLQGMWEQHCGKVSLVNWRLFRDHTHAQELLLSIGQFLMVQICRRLCTDFRMARSGFPDLVLWSPSDRRCKFVEVKGPGDSLSNNQKVWLHFLSQHGGDVEVCHVQTVSTKYLQ